MKKQELIDQLMDNQDVNTLAHVGSDLIIKRVLRNLATRDLLPFIEYTMPRYQTNWHHRLICDYVQRWFEDETGEWSFLIVQCPPRHGKSEIVSRRLPAWILGKDPDAEVMGASYGADLAQRMNRDVQRIIDSKEYSEVFPGTRIKSSGIPGNTRKVRNTKMFEVLDGRGSLVSVGVDGGGTGMGSNYTIIDDPVKNMKEALSPTTKKRVLEWYDSVIQTRLEKGGKVLLTMTRWAQDDLAGELLMKANQDPEATQWKVLSLPAVMYDPQTGQDIHTAPEDTRDIGDPLWEEKKDLDDLLRIERSVLPRVWFSLYQQNPRPDTGEIWKADHFEIWDDEDLADLNIVNKGTDWDLAYTEKEANSATAYIAGGSWNQHAVVIDCGWWWKEFPEMIQIMKDTHPTMPKYIEDKASGKSASQVLEREGIATELVEVEGDKLSRTYDVVSHGIRGKIIIARSVANKLLHDPKQGVIALSPENIDIDINDALTQFLRRVLGKYGLAEWEDLAEDPDLTNNRQRL